MNQSAIKKIRQLYRRDIKKGVTENIRALEKILKPKPRLIPRRLWLAGMRIFLRI